MGEKMTLEQVRDWHRKKAREMDVCGELMFPGPNESPFYRYPSEASKENDRIADAIDAHLTQPAQAVDVGAILQVIAEMRGFRLNTPPNWNHLDAFADRLTAALPNANGKEGVGE